MVVVRLPPGSVVCVVNSVRAVHAVHAVCVAVNVRCMQTSAATCPSATSFDLDAFRVKIEGQEALRNAPAMFTYD